MRTCACGCGLSLEGKRSDARAFNRTHALRIWSRTEYCNNPDYRARLEKARRKYRQTHVEKCRAWCKKERLRRRDYYIAKERERYRREGPHRVREQRRKNPAPSRAVSYLRNVLGITKKGTPQLYLDGKKVLLTQYKIKEALNG